MRERLRFTNHCYYAFFSPLKPLFFPKQQGQVRTVRWLRLATAACLGAAFAMSGFASNDSHGAACAPACRAELSEPRGSRESGALPSRKRRSWAAIVCRLPLGPRRLGLRLEPMHATLQCPEQFPHFSRGFLPANNLHGCHQAS